MSESNPNNTVIPAQKTDLLNPLPDEEIDPIKEHLDMKNSLLNHLDSTSRKIQTAIIVAVVVSGLVQTVVIVAGLVMINDALHP
jgi:hypothetical protein